jgi:phage replication-related protein YjqB (UPF0714/DUF867 family)
MTGEYQSFAELEQNETQGEDYAIFHRRAGSKIAVMAPHGGGIEPGTLDIADAVAGTDHSFYAFKGIKKTGNKRLHISSNQYDEPLGLSMSKQAGVVVSIHGCRSMKERVLIGGRHQGLKHRILAALNTAGFTAEICSVKGLRGIEPENICNRCRSGQGVQLEISRGLREKMFIHFHCRFMRGKTRVFYAFVNSIRNALQGETMP